MNPEIEKLIDLALADGEITDKERSVILKKAEKLGEDPDEVEMILDGRFHESKKLKTKEKSGNIKVCPSCGESVKSFQLNCNGCGHEFRNIDSSNLISEIIKSTSQLSITQRIQYVKSINIPKDKDSIISVLLYCYNQSISSLETNTENPQLTKNYNRLREAYRNKFFEIEKLSKIMFDKKGDDLWKEISDMKVEMLNVEQKIDKQLRKNKTFWDILGYGTLLVIIYLIISYII